MDGIIPFVDLAALRTLLEDDDELGFVTAFDHSLTDEELVELHALAIQRRHATAAFVLQEAGARVELDTVVASVEAGADAIVHQLLRRKQWSDPELAQVERVAKRARSSPFVKEEIGTARFVLRGQPEDDASMVEAAMASYSLSDPDAREELSHLLAAKILAADALPKLDVLIEVATAPSRLGGATQAFIDDAREPGFVELGWLGVTLLDPLLLIGFLGPEKNVMLSLAGLRSDPFEAIAMDLVTSLDSGGDVTTSTLHHVASKPERGLHKFALGPATLRELSLRHEENTLSVAGNPVPAPSSLAELAEWIRSHLERELS